MLFSDSKLADNLKRIISKKYVILIYWIFLAVYATAKQITHNAVNNYLIFRWTFFHAQKGLNLYINYPDQYLDSNHYGPLFSLVMAPFALLPLNTSMYLWQIVNVLILFFAIRQLPLNNLKKNIICLICSQELFISLREFQTNGAIAAFIILSWVLIENKKDFWAAFFILLSFYIKLYGIVGLAFFLFSKQKLKFSLSLIFWAVVLFILPMLVFSPHYILNSYTDWFHSLELKNSQNLLSPYQDVSVMGMIRRIWGRPDISTLPFITCGLLLFMLSYIRIDRFNDLSFKILLLSSVLLFPVLFSTSSELVTYIIAFAGIGIWIMSRPEPASKLQLTIFIFALYAGSLFSTDLFPHYLRSNLIKPYALKALPCLLVWLTIIYEMLKQSARHNYKTNPLIIQSNTHRSSI